MLPFYKVSGTGEVFDGPRLKACLCRAFFGERKAVGLSFKALSMF